MTKVKADKIEIDRLRDHLEKQLGWGPPQNWHSTVFDQLSDQIFEKCQVSLSPTTLKRFWGVVSYDGTPNISTLDTLSKFGGYANWLEFKVSHKKIGNRQSPRAAIPRKSIYVTAGFFIALITIALISNQRINHQTSPTTFTFTSRPVTNSYPNTVVFDFNTEHIDANSFHIQQYWDVTKTISLKPDQKQATGIYYFPGYFTALLVADGQTISEHDLFLESNGWLGTIDYQPVPKYFKPISTINKRLTFQEDLYTEIKNLDNPVRSSYHYTSDLGNISGDDFIVNTALKVSYNDKWAVCQSAQVIILGTSGAMIFPFAKIGCSSDNSLMLNDLYLSGKESDLSAFATDLSKFRNISIIVRNKTVKVNVEDKLIYQGAYQDSMGRFVGLRFKFLGLGEVQSLSVFDQEDQQVELD